MLSVAGFLAVPGRFPGSEGFILAGKEASFLPGDGGNCWSDGNNCHQSHVLGATLVLVVVHTQAGTRQEAYIPGWYPWEAYREGYLPTLVYLLLPSPTVKRVVEGPLWLIAQQ